MSVPNKLGNDSSITKDKGDSKNSDYYKAKNGLAWKGEHVDLDSVVGDYTKEAYEALPMENTRPAWKMSSGIILKI